MAPERVPGMVNSMLQDYTEVLFFLDQFMHQIDLKKGGWLPMWKNIVGGCISQTHKSSTNAAYRN